MMLRTLHIAQMGEFGNRSLPLTSLLSAGLAEEAPTLLTTPTQVIVAVSHVPGISFAQGWQTLFAKCTKNMGIPPVSLVWTLQFRDLHKTCQTRAPGPVPRRGH